MLSWLSKFLGMNTWVVGGLAVILLASASSTAYLKIQNLDLQNNIQSQKYNNAQLEANNARLTTDIAQLNDALNHANTSIESLKKQIIKDRVIADEHTRALIKSKKQLSDKILRLELEAAKNDSDFSKCLNVVVPDDIGRVL